MTTYDINIKLYNNDHILSIQSEIDYKLLFSEFNIELVNIEKAKCMNFIFDMGYFINNKLLFISTIIIKFDKYIFNNFNRAFRVRVYPLNCDADELYIFAIKMKNNNYGYCNGKKSSLAYLSPNLWIHPVNYNVGKAKMTDNLMLDLGKSSQNQIAQSLLGLSTYMKQVELKYALLNEMSNKGFRRGYRTYP